jgi:hypothetical protein
MPPSNALIQATPRNALLGRLSDALASTYSPERTQQAQQLAEFLSVPAISRTLDRLSYGEPLTTGAGGLGGTTRFNNDALEAAMTIAPMVGPAAKLAGKGAMATGRFVAPKAGQLAEQYMVKTGGILPLDVYHGTPHKLPPTARNPLGEFDASKINTGTGAQAYSHGIYSSESPQFADMFAIKKNIPDVEGIAYQNGLQLSRDAQVELMRQATRDSMGKPTKGDNYIDPVAAVKKLQNANIETRQMSAEKLQNTIRDFQNQNKAFLYKVDLPDEKIAKMLDWDKPLSQQSPEVQKALKGIESKFPEIPDFNLRKWMNTDPLASTLHNVLNRDLGVDPANIANIFKEQGIFGVTYKDSNIRNFVTFPGEEKSMKILERQVR